MFMEKKRVVITGLGVLSPIGNTKEDFWNSLLNGKTGVGKLTKFDASNFTCKIAAEIQNNVLFWCG